MQIKNVSVVDPSCNKRGELGDIFISNGKIANRSLDGITIDGTGLTAMAGGIDIHTHLFGASGFEGKSDSSPNKLFDIDDLACRYLAQGITFFVEAGLTTSQIDKAVRQNLPIDYSLLQLDSNESTHTNALTRKYVSEKGVERFLESKIDSTLPPPHIHLPDLAKPGNIEMLERFLEKLDGRRCHLAHLSYYIFGEKNGKPVPLARKAAELLGKNKNVSFDLGPVAFGKTFSFTADSELAGRISKINKQEVNSDEESPYLAVRYNFLKKCYVDATFWLSGMELLLELKDLSNVSLSVDFPSGGDIRSYPQIISCLLSKAVREKFAKKLSRNALQNSKLLSQSREYSLYEIAQITRSSPANACGIQERGSVSEGSIADVALYEIPRGDTGNIDPLKLEDVLGNPKYILKDGKIIYEGGKKV